MKVPGVVLAGCLAGCGRTGVVGDGCLDADRFAAVVESWDPWAGGFGAPQQEEFADPRAALGRPDYTGGGEGTGAVAVGQGGTLTLGFLECWLVPDGSSEPDLRVYEVGGFVERVEVSGRLAPGSGVPDHLWPDPEGFLELGAIGGVVSEIDLDEALAAPGANGVALDAIRLRDDPLDGPANEGSPGADIDAVKILNGVRSTAP